MSSSSEFEPYQSSSFNQIRARVASLATPSPSSNHQQLPCSPTPSPPASESSSSRSPSPKRTNASEEMSSDSSASTSSTAAPLRHMTRRIRPKRVLSEGDIIQPRPTKRSRAAFMSAVRVRAEAITSASSSSSSSSYSDAGRFRRAVRRHKRTKASPMPVKEEAKVLPELRLLSATRTAPIGWTSGTLMKHNTLQERNIAKPDPESQRFWPIINNGELDFTGARMLSLHNPVYCVPPPQAVSLLSKVTVLPASSGSSVDDDVSPRTPSASPKALRTTLSPKTTLGVMIDFTRAQHAARTGPVKIAPRSQGVSAGAERDYFGEWETYTRPPTAPAVAAAGAKAAFGRESRF